MNKQQCHGSGPDTLTLCRRCRSAAGMLVPVRISAFCPPHNGRGDHCRTESATDAEQILCVGARSSSEPLQFSTTALARHGTPANQWLPSATSDFLVHLGTGSYNAPSGKNEHWLSWKRTLMNFGKSFACGVFIAVIALVSNRPDPHPTGQLLASSRSVETKARISIDVQHAPLDALAVGTEPTTRGRREDAASSSTHMRRVDHRVH